MSFGRTWGWRAGSTTSRGRRWACSTMGSAFSDAFLERIGELLEERAGVGTVIARQKPNLSAPAPKAMIEELVNEVDFAVVGVGG